jgi:hypothetical protein
MKLSRREENRTNGWVAARAVEPTCPTTGAGWGRWRVAVNYAFVALLIGGCAPRSDRGVVVTHEGLGSETWC